MLTLLEKKNVGWKDRRSIKELYQRQRGVRQGCCLSPTLSNSYVEEMVGQILEKEEGPSIGDRKINCISFADDTVIIADDTRILQNTVKSLEEGMKEYGMKLKYIWNELN